MTTINRLASHAVLASAVFALMACGSRAAGNDASPPRNLDSLRDFNEVTLAGPDRVIVTRGARYSVRAEGDARALARLEIVVEDHELQIKRKHNWRDIMPGSDRGATIHVTLPALREVGLAGSGDMSVDLLGGDDVEASVAGSGDLSIARVDARSADFQTAGSGTLTASGRAGKAEYSVAGSGDIQAAGLTSGSAEVSIVGSGDVAAQVSGSAKISIIGSGDAVITGTTRCTVTRMGSGSARCTG